MKKLHLGSSLVLFSAIAAGAATLTPENAEVVVVKGSPDVVKVAGRELAGFLSRSFGGEVPVSVAEGRLRLAAQTARDPQNATLLYELAR